MVQTITDQKMASRRKHDAVLMGLLRYHSENLDLLTRTQTYLLQNGKISSDDLLKLLNDKAEIDRQLTSITSDTTMHEQITAPNVVYFDTDSASLMQHIEQSHLDLQQLETEMELSDCRRRAIDFWQTLVITPFARYAVYLRPSLRQSHNLDLGVSFRIPLSYEVQKKRRVLEKEKEVLAHRREVICEQMRREVRLILAELRSYNQRCHNIQT